MNAGAYGGEMSRVVEQVNVVSREGETLCLENETPHPQLSQSFQKHSFPRRGIRRHRRALKNTFLRALLSTDSF